MSILAVLLMQAVLAEEPAPAPAPVEAPAATSQAAAPATATETPPAQQPRMRCRRAAPTGQRLRQRVCEPVDNERNETAEDVTRSIQMRNSGSVNPLGGNP